MIRRVFMMALVLGMLAAPALALRPGDDAPALTEVNWLRGDPIPRWEPGHVYVLDFWATWCGPCIASFPSLISLAKEYEDQNVHVVSIAVWPRRGQTPTRAFVARRQDMDFHIAEDRREGATAQKFLTSSSISSIPHAMVIDKAGKIAWIGHPSTGLEKVVEMVVAGTFDPAELVRQQAAQQVVYEKAQALTQALQEARANGDAAGQLDSAQALLELDPSLFQHAGVYKYYLLLVEFQRTTDAAAYAEELMNKTFAEIPRGLDNLAYVIAANEDIPEGSRDLELALRAATKSNELGEWKDATSLEAIARVHFARDEVDRAIELQEQAIELSVPSRIRDGYETTLAMYREALDGADAPESTAQNP